MGTRLIVAAGVLLASLIVLSACATPPAPVSAPATAAPAQKPSSPPAGPTAAPPSGGACDCRATQASTTHPDARCVVKGTVLAAGGQKVYHLQGDMYYAQTLVDPAKGDRWFCTEEEAKAAGWQRIGGR